MDERGNLRVMLQLPTKIEHNIVRAKDIWWPDISKNIYLVGEDRTDVLFNLCRAMIESGMGFAVIDSRGKLTKMVSTVIPDTTFRNTIWLNAMEGNVAINLLDSPVNDTLDAFQAIYKLKDDAYRLLKHALIVQSYQKNPNISNILTMLQDEIKLREAVMLCRDETARNYFKYNYQKLKDTPRLLADAENPVQGIVEDLMGHPSLASLFCSPPGKLDFGRVIARKQIFLASVPNQLGNRNVALVQALLLAKFRAAALKRKDTTPFPIIVENFDTIGNPNLISATLSQLSDSGVTLVLSHQGQDDEMVKAALKGTQIKIAWQVNSLVLEKEFKRFDFFNMHEQASVLGYEQVVGVRDGERESIMYPSRVMLPMSFKGFCKPENIKTYSMKRYGPKKNEKTLLLPADFV